ncbi:MAG: O-acetyl-ADP-ribose deacetylase [Candidatus Omnitrophica bacterium]|nr:O-acetyl-ADP-ribose deacetylase [Candidatus Omnitrophota bacterium]
MGTIEIVVGDITTQNVDAIVNAANTSLLGGGGVDGAIHRAAGPALLEECRKFNGCPTGEAHITQGYNLRASFVIHTVGPVWNGGNHGEDILLASCYRAALELAGKNNVKTIAFPSISTGAYRFPVIRASRIALTEIKKYLATHALPEKITIVCFNQGIYDIYCETAKEIDGI